MNVINSAQRCALLVHLEKVNDTLHAYLSTMHQSKEDQRGKLMQLIAENARLFTVFEGEIPRGLQSSPILGFTPSGEMSNLDKGENQQSK